jgi:hypothetical protein
MIEMLIGAALEATVEPDRLEAATRPSRGTPAARIVFDASQPPPGWEKFAECVAARESNHNPNAVNGASLAAGLYQFLPAWRNGLPYMVADRLVRFGMPRPVARTIRVDLARTPIQGWAPVYQRIGFAEVIDRGGDEHWALPGSRCEQYR